MWSLVVSIWAEPTFPRGGLCGRAAQRWRCWVLRRQLARSRFTPWTHGSSRHWVGGKRSSASRACS